MSALRIDSGCALISLLKRYNRPTVSVKPGSLPNEVLFSLTVQSVESAALNAMIVAPLAVAVAVGLGVRDAVLVRVAVAVLVGVCVLVAVLVRLLVGFAF